MAVPYALMGVLAGGERYGYARAGRSARAGHSGVVWMELWIGIPTGFLVVGRIYPAATYAVFGPAGGYLGFLVLGSLRRAGLLTSLAEKR